MESLENEDLENENPSGIKHWENEHPPDVESWKMQIRPKFSFPLLTKFSVFYRFHICNYFKVMTLDLSCFADIFKLDQLNTMECHFSIKRHPTVHSAAWS